MKFLLDVFFAILLTLLLSSAPKGLECTGVLVSVEKCVNNLDPFLRNNTCHRVTPVVTPKIAKNNLADGVVFVNSSSSQTVGDKIAKKPNKVVPRLPIEVDVQNISKKYRGTPLFRKINTPFEIELQVEKQQKEIFALINYVATTYMQDCVNIVLYDEFYEKKARFLKMILKNYPIYYVNGRIHEDSETTESLLTPQEGKCSSFLVLITDIGRTGNLLGNQSLSKVAVVTDASVWKIKEFLSISKSQGLVNLLVIANSYLDGYKRDINIYTHGLWLDEIGSSEPQIVSSWRKGKLSMANRNLFPKKITQGFNGFKFTVSVRHQPPHVIKRNRTSENGKQEFYWDGLEIRLLKMLAESLNYTLMFQEPAQDDPNGVEVIGVVQELFDGRADIGASGMYVTPDRIKTLDMTHGHSFDCAAFLTLTTTALPRYGASYNRTEVARWCIFEQRLDRKTVRFYNTTPRLPHGYRAIMGPFHWQVWMGLTLVYFFAIFPLAFSYRHTLKHLWRDPWEIENMFWYVFGTFTNCFTFSGEKSWSVSTKHTTRLIVGIYWAFSIIITACYTGSVIAFITIPVFPSVLDTSKQIYDAGYSFGTLDGGGWKEWFLDSADPIANKIFERIEYVPTVMDGLVNVTTNFFWPYAFLGSRAWLAYVVQANYSTSQEYKRALLHLGKECFVPFNVALAFPPRATYTPRFNEAVLRATQSGLVQKLVRDLEWEVQRSSTGKLLQAASGPSLKAARPEERMLNLDDCQGTFLLLGAGFLIATTALAIECFSSRGKKKYMERHQQQQEQQEQQQQQQQAFVVTRSCADEDDVSADPSFASQNIMTLDSNSRALSLDTCLDDFNEMEVEADVHDKRAQTT